MIGPKDLQKRFGYHAPTTDAVRGGHEMIRDECLQLAEFIDRHVVDGREKSLAITKIEEAMFWANASVAREQTFQ